MSEREIAVEMIHALELLQIPYMVVGSFSSNVYGVPRSTRDLDIVFEVTGFSLKALAGQLGPTFEIDPQLTFEGITGTKKHLIKKIGEEFQVELFRLSSDSFDQQRFARRIRCQMEGETVWMATPEDVVIQKLRWWKLGSRGKDRDDVEAVISVQGNSLDWNYIEHWCEIHGSRTELDRLRDELKPFLDES